MKNNSFSTYCFIDAEFTQEGHIRELALVIVQKESFKIIQAYNLFLKDSKQHNCYNVSNCITYTNITISNLIETVNHVIIKYSPLFVSYSKSDIQALMKEYYCFYTKEPFLKNIRLKELKNKMFLLSTVLNVGLSEEEKYCCSYLYNNVLDFYIFGNQRYKMSLSLENLCSYHKIKPVLPCHLAINDTLSLYYLAKHYYFQIEKF